MELQILMKRCCHIALLLLAAILVSCEKEISIDLPESTQQYVVEASVNQYFPSLNYVFISKSVDYFNPDLSVRGVGGASVYITEGSVNGTDTSFNGTRTQLFDIAQVPGIDTIFRGLSGVYFSPLFSAQANKPYLLEITLADGQFITGKTFIPPTVPIDSIGYEIRDDKNNDGHNDAFVTFHFTDPPAQNNYRLALHNYTDSVMIGWGSADSYRTFDDEMLNGEKRIIPYINPFQQGDTLNFYFSSIGRKEYLFWQSFGSAANNGGPFATPAQLRSNIKGAIGSFTGYSCSFKQVILK